MEDDLKVKFSRIIAAASDLPAWVAHEVAFPNGLESQILDKSYLDFLDEQMALAPRGPEWTSALKKRRKALAEYCGKTLISGTIRQGNKICYLKIGPNKELILHWELWDENS